MQSCTHTYSKRRRQKALGVEKRMPATSGTPEGRCGQSWSAALCIQLVEGDVCRETRHPFLLIKVRPNGNQNFPKGEFHFFKFSYVMLITEDPKYQEASWQKTTWNLHLNTISCDTSSLQSPTLQGFLTWGGIGHTRVPPRRGTRHSQAYNYKMVGWSCIRHSKTYHTSLGAHALRGTVNIPKRLIAVLFLEPFFKIIFRNYSTFFGLSTMVPNLHSLLLIWSEANSEYRGSQGRDIGHLLHAAVFHGGFPKWGTCFISL